MIASAPAAPTEGPGLAGAALQAVILTPEHVPVVLVPAGLGSRFIARAVDTAIMAWIATMASVAAAILLPGWLVFPAQLTAVFVVFWGYDVLCELAFRGRTAGKKAMRLRVVDSRGLPVTARESLVRNLVRALDALPVFYGAGGLFALFDGHMRRLGDVAAGTLVIREETPPDVTRHLGDARRFNTLRTPAVLRRARRRISLEEREFLLELCMRAPKMEEKARFDLMTRVGDHYRRELDIEDEHLSGENIVRGLTAILFEK